ncbi:protein mono-ADP-ribosyltransferase PARP14-like isoform X2 [Mercenaria mercenaria]|uniref:protein mono-ADP-ribosyltransferase PARP14-like isoform X2 n=1 Tax=Mercenaria mercenaria TaxID=6596 RepID=UPI00234F41E5|nr:protein mono-ADP-ribosyltransferase PARP14-like isoform X2 [Mercenaria mercenaria]
MGSGAAKPGKSIAHLDFDPSQSNIVQDTENTKVIKNNTEFNVATNTYVSNTKTVLNKNMKIDISCSGGGVIRIGLTTTNPSDTVNILQGSVFEKEEGFGQEETSRILYKSEFDHFWYGPPNEEREYGSCSEQDSLWLYVIHVYGVLDIKAQLIESDKAMDLQLCPLVTDQSRATAINPNTAVCKIRESVVKGDIYHCRWNMKLENENITGKAPTYGYMCLRLVSMKNDTEKEETLWERKSAVLEYPFSSVIAFRLNIQENEVEHNLLINSVGTTQKDYFEKEVQPESLYFVIEFSSGQLEVTHGKGLRVAQEVGSILLISDYKTDIDEADAREILLETSSKLVCFQPHRIQFGDSTGKFALEFNEKLTDRDITLVQRKLSCPVKQLQETDTVQLVVNDIEGIDEDLVKFDIESHFSWTKAGGGVIVSTVKDKIIPGCWLVQYRSKETARKIWTMKTHSFIVGGEHVKAHVFPVFKELGLTVNNGEKPVFDTSALVLKVDKDKLRFIRKRDSEKNAFIASLNRTVEVDVNWAANTKDDSFVDEFEEEEAESEDDKIGVITLECRVPKSEGIELAVWKDKTKTFVLNYFRTCIHEVTFNVGDDAVETILDVLSNLQKEYLFEFEENLRKKKVKLFGSDSHKLQHVADIARKPIVVQEHIQELVKVAMEKYLALDAEGILDQVKIECPYTSFKVNRDTEMVTLKGPKDEVHDANRKILKLAIDTSTIELPLSVEQTEFMQRGGQDLLRNEFRKVRMNPNFSISENNVIVVIFTGNGVTEDKRKREMLGIVEKLINTCLVPVNKDSVSALQTDEWKHFKQELVKRANEHLIIVDPDTAIISEQKNKQIIRIIGTTVTTKFAKLEVENFLKHFGNDAVIPRLPVEIAEYLDEFQRELYSGKVEFVKDSNGCVTGELTFHGKAEDIAQMKEKIEKDIKNISSHWFYIKKSWIASVVQNLVDLKILSNKEKFLLQLDIGHSLAVKRISGVAILPRSGTAIQVKQGDVILETTAAIVHSTNGYKTAFERGLGKRVIEFGGEEIREQLLQELHKRKSLKKQLDNRSDNLLATEDDLDSGFIAGDVIMTGSGQLRCVKVLHAFAPKIDSGKSEEVEHKNLLRKILQTCHDKGMATIALSAIACGAEKQSNLNVTLHMVEAVTEFVKDTKGSVIKEVVLCDSSKTVVDKFTEALGTLKDPWFVFRHGQKIEVKDETEDQSKRPNSSSELSRPYTPGLRWGRRRAQIVQDEEEEQETDHSQPEASLDFGGGLPYHIPLTNRLTLHVVKGDITHQSVNVIVSTTSEFPNLTGSVANALMKSGGNTILQECKTLGSISEGQIGATGAGNLNSDKIYHVLIPNKWDSKKGDEFVYKMVTSCLTEAINSGYSTIAFPTIGTGRLGFPPDGVAHSMINAVCDIGSHFTNASLTDVTIVVYSMAENLCRIFQDEVPLYFKKTGHDKNGSSHRNGGGNAAPPTSDIHNHLVDDVVIVKIVSQTNGIAIQKKLEDIVDKEYVTKKVSFKELAREKMLSNSEEMALKKLEQEFGVSVHIEKSTKCVKITELKKRVDDSEFAAVKLLEHEFPTSRLKERNEKIVAANVQWYYDDADGKTHPVDAESNYLIHEGYLNGQDFQYYNGTKKKEYKMIIDDMSEHPVDNPADKRRLHLRTNIDKEIALPHTWSITEKNEDFAEVQLKGSETEFNEVKLLFIKGGCKSKSIVSITRLENRFLWLQYQTKMRQLQKQNLKTQNERRLWHGTDINTVPKIIKNGYDRSFTSVFAYGRGAYFAAHSSYSDNDRFAVPDAHGNKRMFLNRVLVGVPCVGNSNMHVLPVRKDLTVDNIKVYYDSAVDKLKQSEIFVIFHDTQAYPEYLIEYK